MSPEAAATFDEMGLGSTGNGLTLRERLLALLDGPSGHVLLLGENGTGRSIGLRLFASRAAERGHAVLERQGPLWRVSRSSGQTLSRELWPLLVGLKSEQASLVVDDVDDLDGRAQGQLAEALGSEPRSTSVYLLASSHSALARLVGNGGFSETIWTLFDEPRIVRLPPLRSEPGQIAQLARRIIRQVARRFDIEPPPRLHPKAIAHLQAYAWPGNVRQLQQVLERAVLGCSNGEVGVHDLPTWLLDGDEYGLMRAARASMSLEDLERCYVEIVLRMVGGHRSRAAAILGINRKTLGTKIQRHGISIPPGQAPRGRSSDD